MTKLISLKEIPKDLKIALLKELDFDSDGMFVLEKNGEKHMERYMKSPIRLDNMLIFPGSTIILDDNPVSVASYLEEFGDVL